MPCLLKINLIMNLLNYLKSKYRKFISIGLDNENKNQNLNLEQSNKIANSITLLIMGLSGLTLFWMAFAKTDQIIIDMVNCNQPAE